MKRTKIFITLGFLACIMSYCSAGTGVGLIVLRIHNETTGYFDTPAEILVTDSQGRRTGYSLIAPFDNSEQLNMFEEIPGAIYSQEGVGASSDEDPYAVDDSGFSNSRELRLQEAVQDKYTLQIIGRKTGKYSLDGTFEKTDGSYQSLEDLYGFIVQGQTTTMNIEYSPVPGTPAPVITKTVTFNALRQDLTVAQQLKQIGDDRFVRSLVGNIDLTEKLAGVCDRRKGKKGKGCQPAVAVLKLFIKRLELANRKCDNPADCDEEREWAAFRKEHGKDSDFKDFWREWDRDDWHKHKKQCKRFITDEALKIISEDAGWLIKSLGGEIGDGHETRAKAK